MEQLDQVAEVPASQEESPVIADQTADTAPADEQDKPKVDHDKIQRRIDKLTRDRYQAKAEAEMTRREAEALRRQLEELRQPRQTQQQGEPKIEDFQNLDEYVAAKAEYVADRKLAAAFEQREAKQRETETAKSQQAQAEQWSKRMASAAEKTPDLYEVIESASAPLTRAMADAIMDSDLGPQVAYYLAQNPEEAERLSGLSASSVARAIGRIEAKLESESLKTKSAAPKPVDPVGSRAAAAKDPGRMSDEEYAKWRKSGRRAA